MRNIDTLRQFIKECLLLENKVGYIRKLGFSNESADFIYSIDPRNSIWIAQYMLDLYRLKRPGSTAKDLIASNQQELEFIYNKFFKEEIDKILNFAKERNLNLKNFTTKQIREKLIDHQASEESEQGADIVMTFPDGFYWINLNKSSCSIEARRMGHCGEDSRGNLWSLRDKNKNSHVTMTVDPQKKIIQLKGKENNKPNPKYHKYIAQVIPHAGLKMATDEDKGDLKPSDFSENILKWLYQQTGDETFNIENMRLEQAFREIRPELFTFIRDLWQVQANVGNMDDEEMIGEFKAKQVYNMIVNIRTDAQKYYQSLSSWNSFSKVFSSIEEAQKEITELMSSVSEYLDKNGL